jgi:heterodisulfide reductase subunit B
MSEDLVIPVLSYVQLSLVCLGYSNDKIDIHDLRIMNVYDREGN